MSGRKSTLPRNTSAGSKTYLTKRILVSAAKNGIAQASEDTMQIMGYTIIAQDGWVVKKLSNGEIEKIKPLPPTENHELVLD